MRVVRNTSLQIDAPTGPNNRRHGRVRCVCLRCFLAQHETEEVKVLDVSASGLRLQLRRPLGITDGMTIQVILVSPGGRIELPARVVWSKRAGYRRFELGATFGATTDELRQKLGPVIRATGNNYVVYDGAHTL